MGQAIGTGARAVGAAARSVIESSLDDCSDNFALDSKIVKERINDLRQITELRLEKFYDRMVLKATGSCGSSATVPICSVVSSKESLFVATSEVITKELPSTVHAVVNGTLKSRWRDTIAELIIGGLETFFGPTYRASSGTTSDTEQYCVVWANNAMLRLDVYVTKTYLCQMAGFDKSQEVFGGYVMVVSVVDIAKINWQVFLYEFSKFYEKAKEQDVDACETVLKSIADTQKLLKATGVLFDEAKEISPKEIHPEPLTVKPLNPPETPKIE